MNKSKIAYIAAMAVTAALGIETVFFVKNLISSHSSDGKAKQATQSSKPEQESPILKKIEELGVPGSGGEVEVIYNDRSLIAYDKLGNPKVREIPEEERVGGINVREDMEASQGDKTVPPPPATTSRVQWGNKSRQNVGIGGN